MRVMYIFKDSPLCSYVHFSSCSLIRFFEVETCRSVARSKENENCVFVSEWRRKNGKIDPTHSCPMNVQVELPKESAFVTDSSLILAEKLLVTLVS